MNLLLLLKRNLCFFPFPKPFCLLTFGFTIPNKVKKRFLLFDKVPTGVLRSGCQL